MEEWRYSFTILDLGTRWGRVVSFTPRPLYPRGKSPRYPSDRRLGGPQSRSGRYGEDKNFATAGNRTPAIQPVTIPTELCWLYMILHIYIYIFILQLKEILLTIESY
jgi:hypothetical protein